MRKQFKMEFTTVVNYVFDPNNVFKVVFTLAMTKLLFATSCWRYPLLSILYGIIPAYLQGCITWCMTRYISGYIYWIIPVAYILSCIHFAFVVNRTDPVKIIGDIIAELRDLKESRDPKEPTKQKKQFDDPSDVFEEILEITKDTDVYQITFEHIANGETTRVVIDTKVISDDTSSDESPNEECSSDDSENSYECPNATPENTCGPSTGDQ